MSLINYIQVYETNMIQRQFVANFALTKNKIFRHNGVQNTAQDLSRVS